jgi:hypothetical protein
LVTAIPTAKLHKFFGYDKKTMIQPQSNSACEKYKPVIANCERSEAGSNRMSSLRALAKQSRFLRSQFIFIILDCFGVPPRNDGLFSGLLRALPSQ